MSRSYDALVMDDVGVLSGVRDDESAALEAVLRVLRADGLRTALLSNAGGCGRPHWNEGQWPDLFDTVALSGMTGVVKPDAAAYLLVAERLGVEPARCVFVDDLRRNVLGAVAVGMTGIHHTSLSATLDELEVLLEQELPRPV